MAFDNSYARLPERFFARLAPTPVQGRGPDSVLAHGRRPRSSVKGGGSSGARSRQSTTYDASVKKALKPSQQDLIDHKEHCSADPEKLATVGRALGHQVRIKRNDSEYGLYTVSQVCQESPDSIVRMGVTGRKRLGTSDEFVGTLDSQVPHPPFNDAEAETNNEFVERLEDNGTHTGLVVIAPHGGDIELHTDHQVERVASATRGQGGQLVAVQGF